MKKEIKACVVAYIIAAVDVIVTVLVGLFIGCYALALFNVATPHNTLLPSDASDLMVAITLFKRFFTIVTPM